MKKLKAYLFRSWHCLYHTIKLDFGHREFTITTKESGNILERTNYIGCECGKYWYKDKQGEILLKQFQA